MAKKPATSKAANPVRHLMQIQVLAAEGEKPANPREKSQIDAKAVMPKMAADAAEWIRRDLDDGKVPYELGDEIAGHLQSLYCCWLDAAEWGGGQLSKLWRLLRWREPELIDESMTFVGDQELPDEAYNDSHFVERMLLWLDRAAGVESSTQGGQSPTEQPNISTEQPNISDPIFPNGALPNERANTAALFLLQYSGDKKTRIDILREFTGETKGSDPKAQNIAANLRTAKNRGKLNLPPR